MSIINKVKGYMSKKEDLNFILPEYLYKSVAKKTNKDKIDYDDVLIMSLELWLNEKPEEDIRLRYLNFKAKQAYKRISKMNYLIVENTKVFYDDFRVYPIAEKGKNLYQVRVDYILQGIVVASSIEFDMEDLYANV